MSMMSVATPVPGQKLSKKDRKKVKMLKSGKSFRAKNAPVNSLRPDILVPTPEYLAQPGGPQRGQQGGYRVIDALERLWTRHLLDSASETLNEAMYLAALKLRDLWRRAGLDDPRIGAIDMDRIIGGRGNPAFMLPPNEAMADARRECRYALRVMGYYGEPGKIGYFPHRGSGRVVHEVVCRGSSVEEAAILHTNTPGERGNAVAMSKLQDGLVALVSLWRLVGRKDDLRGAVKAFRDFPPGQVAW